MRYLPGILAIILMAAICPAQDRVTSGVKAISSNPAKRLPPVPSSGESFTSFTLEPGVRVTLQQETGRDKTLGTHLICYLLPNGSTTEYRILNSPAPSIRAASSRLSGRLWKNERMTIILKALEAAGSTTAQ